MDLHKGATGKTVLLKPPAKPFACAWSNSKAANVPCEVVDCPGVFDKMPPMLEGQLLPCYKDCKSGKSGEQINLEMQTDKVIPLRKIV